jgi:hypothetical protein
MRKAQSMPIKYNIDLAKINVHIINRVVYLPHELLAHRLISTTVCQSIACGRAYRQGKKKPA